MKYIKKILLWLYLKLHTIKFVIGGAMYNVEDDILKADPFNLKEGDKKIQRMRSRNKTLEKFYAGVKDEKYTEHYYEILRKADKFMKTATPHKMAVAADVRRTNFGMADVYGRTHEHYGFFDDKHKHSGKTLEEVLALEYEERRTKDDDYEIMFIFNNKPIEVGLAKVMDVIEKTEKENVDYEYEVKDIQKKSKQFEFPIKAFRDDNEIINKIEQLTEFLHIKRIGFEVIQLEFFIPLKYKTKEIEENSKIYEDITNISGIFAKNEFGDTMWFGITKFTKRIIHNDTHEVWKFEGVEIKQIN